MSKNPEVKLKVVPATGVGHVVSAPPVLQASDHSIDYVCGNCGVALLRAESNQVHGMLIHCTKCGSYNATET